MENEIVLSSGKPAIYSSRRRFSFYFFDGVLERRRSGVT
jgi:hypothetical protein